MRSKIREVRELSRKIVMHERQEKLHAQQRLRASEHRKSIEEENRQLEQQLIQAQKLESIGQLAGGVAHDFNNLLTPIMCYSEMCLMQMEPEDLNYEELEGILHTAESARNLTQQLLAFSRKQVLEMKSINISDIVYSTEKILNRTIREDIEIRLDLDENLNWVYGDSTQLEQIIMNLSVNAQDAMPTGGKLLIETSNTELDEEYTKTHANVTPGNHVLLSVSDTGEGMDQELLTKIFEPFYTTKAKGKGTGLGLSTVYGIVKQHNGSIWVYSEPGKGTTFKIFLPEIQEELSQKSDDSKPEKYSKGSETVLVVEDDDQVRKLVSRMMRSDGYCVIEAADVREAFIKARQTGGSVDLLLTDVVMPEMNGMQLYQKLLIYYPDLIALFMSGYTENIIHNQGVFSDMPNFVQKPFTYNELARTVRNVLDTSICA
ncbi:MAG: response regulator [Calditrichaeota bacterium]|nr:response regulator [Calditrichota bacterium]